MTNCNPARVTIWRVFEVDFGEMADDGTLGILHYGAHPALGSRVHLKDGDGNRCEGTVVMLKGNGYGEVRPDWDSWEPAS